MCFLDRQEANTVPRETLVGNLPHGAEVTARVIEIDYGAMRLRLSSKSAVLAENARWEEEYLRAMDDFYHVLSDREQAEIEAAKRVRAALRSSTRTPCCWEHCMPCGVPSERARPLLHSADSLQAALAADNIGL